MHSLSSSLSFSGVEKAVISPGSRNAPLTVALNRNPYIECFSVVDERSAGFIALGMAKASGKPVVICCTSGTALLNYYPAIAEAFYSGIPLVVLSADRPPELIDNWDGQCIRQELVFDQHVLASFSIPASTDLEPINEDIRDIVHNALQEAVHIAGPIHINVPLREPLYESAPTDFNFKVGALVGEEVKNLDVRLEGPYQKVLVVNGASHHRDENLEVVLKKIVSRNKCVVLNDVISNQRAASIEGYDALLLKGAIKELKPDLLITTGKFCLSKSLKLFLKKYKPPKHIHLCEKNHLIGDPFQTNPEVLEGNSSFLLEIIAEQIEASEGYAKLWKEKNELHWSKVTAWINEAPFGEFTACSWIANKLHKTWNLHLSNSTPVRYFSYLKPLVKVKEVHANRGTSGIDGCTSTAVGMAIENAQELHILITGDLAFFYDVNALWNQHLPSNLKIVVLNNGGGGIFRYINGPKSLPEHEVFFETAHNRTAALVCQDFGINYYKAGNIKELSVAWKNLIQCETATLMEVFTDKEINEELFKQFMQI